VPATAAVTCPLLFVFKSDPATPDTKILVELAVVAVIIVVDAKGIERPVAVGAEKLIVRPEPPTKALVPESEIAVPAVGEVVATLCTALVPAPYKSCDDVNDDCPVPPLPTGRMPVMSLARSIAAVATAPAVAFKKPVTFLNVNPVEAMSCDVDACPATVIAVDDAYGNVDATLVDVAVNVGDVIVLYAVSDPRIREFPNTSKIFPVVEVAFVPIKITSAVSDG